MNNISRLLLLFLPFITILTGCDLTNNILPSEHTNGLKVEVINSGLEYPWAIAFLPDNSALVTERTGRLRLLKDGKVSAPIKGLPDNIYKSQFAGLFDVVLDPDYENNHQIFISYSKGTDAANGTTLIKANFDGTKLSNVKEIFTTNTLKNTKGNFGGRVVFLQDKTILLTVGDGYELNNYAQSPTSYLGKVIHIDRDGNAVGKSKIFTLGHHNPQGLAYDTNSGRIYEHEHGPKGGDELNILKEGKNYGWPNVSEGTDLLGNPVSKNPQAQGMEQPFLFWNTTLQPSGMVVYDGKMFKDWKGNILISTLEGQQIRRIKIKKGRVTSQEALLVDLETSFRDVAIAPDGSIWALTDEPYAEILRITPH